MELNVASGEDSGVVVARDADVDHVLTATGFPVVARAVHGERIRAVCRGNVLVLGGARAGPCPAVGVPGDRAIAAGGRVAMEGEASERARPRRRAVRAMLHPLERASPGACFKAERREIPPVAEFAAARHLTADRP